VKKILYVLNAGVIIVKRNNYCPQCGLMFRLWMHKTEHAVCDECDPVKFKELHKQNLRTYKKKEVGQQHITEHTFFPKTPSASERNRNFDYRRAQK
jgi:ribosomal protein S27AE